MTTPIHGINASNPDSKLLRIKIIQAKDLIKDIIGSNNPYVQIALHKKNDDNNALDTVKTNTIRKTSNPTFNQDFIFNVIPNEHKLIIDIFDENKKRNDFIGRVVIPLDNSRIIISNLNDLNAKNHIDFNLEKKTFLSKVKGKLTVMLHYIPSITSFEEEINANNITNTMASLRTSNTTETATVAPSPSISDNTPLPEGWEQRNDQNGRIYYIDHTTRRTTWIRPTASTSQRSNSSSNVHSAMERHLVTDNDTRLTSQNSVPQTTTTATSVTNTTVTQSVEAKNNTTTNLNSTAAPVVPIPTVKNEQALPAGWEVSYTDTGRMFFIDHNSKATTWVDPRTGKPSPVPALTFENRIGPLPAGWEERRHVDGRIFYIDHNNRTTQWEDPRLQKFAGPAVPYSRDYKQKYDAFKKSLPPPPSKPNQFGATDKYLIRVRRSYIYEDSYNKIMHERTNDLLRSQLWVEFDGEKSYDYGGVSREWFHVLSKEIFNPYYGLFEYSAIDNYTLQINPNSGLVNDHHLDYFYFIGKIVGMAAYHNRLIDGFFIRPFYKMMLTKSIQLQDIEAVDAEYYKSLKYIMETEDVDSLDLTFTSEADIYGQKVEHELKPGGKDIKVNKDNRKEFVDLVIQWRFVKRIEKQMVNFMKGFNEIVPQRCISIFDPKELELLLSGLGDVNIKDWQANTVFKGEYNPQHRVIQWFWMAMYSFPNELRLRFLQFVTGTSRVPMNGFAELQGSNGYQKFTIQSWGDYKQLPRAHTCFNRLDLPMYRSYEELREKLLLAIENSEGFDGVD